MTTTIAPTLGHGVLETQQGVGTTPGYDAIDDRRMLSVQAVQEGVYGTSDFMVVQRAAGGAAMFVDIGNPAGGLALVQGDAVTGQGLYVVPSNTSTPITEAIASADATNPRIDRVVLEVKDNLHDSSGSNLAQVRVITGTPTGGATLDNLTGAAAVPSSALLLADVRVPNAATSVTNANIRDRRKWARGAYNVIHRTPGVDYSILSATAAVIDSTNLQPRIECSGAPVRVTLEADWSPPNALSTIWTDLYQDGSPLNQTRQDSANPGTANPNIRFHAQWFFTPSAGSHLFAPWWHSNGSGTILLRARSDEPVTLIVEEILRQNTPNNSVTTG